MRHHWLPLLALTILIAFCIGDSSAQWYPQNSGTEQDLNAVYFTDATRGWVVGDGGIVLHATNGGTTWTPQLSGTSVSLFDVSFANSWGYT